MLVDVAGYYVPAIAGPEGPAGPAGPQGLSAWDVIPPGVTVTGNVVWDENVIQDNAHTLFYTALPAKAPAGLSLADVNFASDASGVTIDDDPTCAGTSSAPTAPPGKVCIFLSSTGGMDGAEGRPAPTALTDSGFVVYWNANGPRGTDMYMFATWAYTAPDAAPITDDEQRADNVAGH